MTLAVAVAVRDAIVLAADSRMSGAGRVQSDSVDKIIRLSDRLAVATSGDAYIEDLPLRDILLTLFEDSPETVEEACSNLRDKLVGLIPHLKTCPQFSLLVVGYDSNQTGQIYRLHFPAGVMIHQGSTKTMGIAMIGETLAISRLINGIDPRLELLVSEVDPFSGLVRSTSNESNAEIDASVAMDRNSVSTETRNPVTGTSAQPGPEVPSQISEMLGKYTWYLGLSHYTTQDAIDLCDFLMQVTMGAQRFVLLDGPKDDPTVMSQGVGGPVDILVLTRHRSGWHRKKATYLP